MFPKVRCMLLAGDGADFKVLIPFASIAKDAPTVTGLFQNPDMDTSPVLKALEGAATAAKDRRNVLLLAIQSHDDIRYSSPRPTWAWFTPPSARRPQLPRTDDRPDCQPPAKKTRTTSSAPSRPTDDARPKQPGMLICHQGRLPRCEMLFPLTDVEKAPLCFGWTFVGYSCRALASGKRCKFFHASSVQDIPDKQRKRFIDWVSTTPRISFAPGKGPSPEVAVLSSRSHLSPILSLCPPGQTSPSPASPPSEPIALPIHSKFLPTPHDPHLLQHPPMDLPSSERDRLVMSLDPTVQDVINCKYGKPTTSISFCSEYVFRHVVPHLFASTFLDETSTELLRAACPLYRLYEELVNEFSPFDPHLAQGYSPYLGFRDETEINLSRVHHVSAALAPGHERSTPCPLDWGTTPCHTP
ncbi:hypothetical protein IV203_032404 [Nitzschia inconspicua]|uniref:Uncharacterized protein n=1 Tax=Nitzschia inconspicua TaxID=303405 RepID=A0A9K3KJK4_9STRA|nr:hypothetical protein IV203_032404 [Nitzschia inconspicua]